MKNKITKMIQKQPDDYEEKGLKPSDEPAEQSRDEENNKNTEK